MVERRAFLQSLGGGLLVLLAAEDLLLGQESGGGRRGGGGRENVPQNVAAWLHIAPDGKVTGFTGKVEVGQNARTSLTQAVADELRCRTESVRLIMGDTGLTPWDMGTVGSRTTPTMAPQMRRMAATARETLLTAAAAKWQVDPKTLRLSDGVITGGGSDQSVTLGALAATVNWATVMGADTATAAANWTVAGKSVPKINAREIVTGQHRYTPDFKLPGMLYGRVLRAPSFGARLQTLDTSVAEAMESVKVVREGDFVGVTAPDEHLAGKALASLRATWQEKPQIGASELFGYLKAHAKESESGAAIPPPAAVKPAIATAAKTLKATYTVAYIAHVPLEPRAAVAHWQEGKLTVWTGSQRPFGVRSELAESLGVPEGQVRVIVPDTGSGYGGKHTGECALEAARLARAAARPVKLIWTREEEFTWAYFRPAGVIEVASGMTNEGVVTQWIFENYLSGPSGINTPYNVPGASVQYYPSQSPLRVGSYRGLAATANHFARESHMDELAALVGMDPLEFRRKNLENARLRAVLDAAAERFGWTQKKKRAGRGYGLACGMEKGGYVACCVEVSLGQERQVRVERVVEAWECGAIVNPEHLKNQVQGAILMGLGGALFEAIDFADGRILNDRLSKYRVPRFSDVPEIDLVLLDRKDLPSAGAGETPIVAIAPAIANAICQASGLRVRQMPILPAFAAQRA